MKIGLIDPACYRSNGVPSPNIGDQIISRAIHRELVSIFGQSTEIITIPSHQYPSPHSLKKFLDTDYHFVGGSNLLWFKWWRPASWKIGLFGLLSYRNLILMGPGWGDYRIKPNGYGRWVCDTILSSVHVHAVRDNYTFNIAKNHLAINNIANTACPTMWCLNDELINSIHRTRSNECIFSLTDYRKNPILDGQLIKDLTAAYNGRLLFWPQGKGDISYCKSLGYSGRIIKQSLADFLNILDSGPQFDYIGTRLHAGILCLEHRVRTLIIGIDNRATEIAADTGLPMVQRGDRDALFRWIEKEPEIHLRLPNAAIVHWRQQFISLRDAPRTDISVSSTVQR